MYYIYKYIYSYMIIYLYTVGPLKAFPSARALWQISVLNKGKETGSREARHSLKIDKWRYIE